jgi:HEAT repeat protein
VDELSFRDYLRSLISDPATKDWGDRYTSTWAELPLQVQQVVNEATPENSGERKQDLEKQQQPKRVQFAVLEGLRKLALVEKQHVLLVGRPGSGKSTALRRLLWEEAQGCLESLHLPSPQPLSQFWERGKQIPVLLELREFRSGTVLAWIQQKLRLKRLKLSEDEIADLLLDERLLLLFDGVNELPSSSAWQELDSFRRDFTVNPMIFSTRELGVGTDLGLEKKLEMLALTEMQMQEFIHKRLPGKADQLLRQMQDRLQELAETPLLLTMLCDTFAENGAVPRSRGELFRKEFDRRYDSFKPLRTQNVDENFRFLAKKLLQELAVAMMAGDSPTEFYLQIPKAQAERILEGYLQTCEIPNPTVKASEYLEDLLEHHLLQLAANPEQIEFHHQLFQEYYAAEWLLTHLSSLLQNEAGKKRLREDYLNLFKWTEAIILMMALIDDENKNIDVVRLALDVDLKLGSRLSGAVKLSNQKSTVKEIQNLAVTEFVKLSLLEATQSVYAESTLENALKHVDPNIRRRAAWILRAISEAAAIRLLKIALNDTDSNVRESAIWALDELKSKDIVEILDRVLKEDTSPGVRLRATFTLQEITTKSSILSLLRATTDSEDDVSSAAIDILTKADRKDLIETLIVVLRGKDTSLKIGAVEVLSELDDEIAARYLREAQLDLSDEVHIEATCALMRLEAKKTLQVQKQIEAARKNHEEERQREISKCLAEFNDGHSVRKGNAVSRLADLIGKESFPIVLEALSDSDRHVRFSACNILNAKLIQRFPEEISFFESVILKLILILEDEDSYPKFQAIPALGLLGDKRACSSLLKAIKHQDAAIRREAAKALIQLKCEEVEPKLIEALNDSDPLMRSFAVKALGEIQSKEAIPGLIQLLEDSDVLVQSSICKALEKFEGEIVANYLPTLAKLIASDVGDQALRAIAAIQSQCKFYNYEIFQAAQQEAEKRKQEQKAGSQERGSVIYDLRGANIGSFAHEVKGNQKLFQFNQVDETEINPKRE